VDLVEHAQGPVLTALDGWLVELRVHSV
jgi:hypothetical protein